jgi:hypothetical protein
MPWDCIVQFSVGHGTKNRAASDTIDQNDDPEMEVSTKKRSFFFYIVCVID